MRKGLVVLTVVLLSAGHARAELQLRVDSNGEVAPGLYSYTLHIVAPSYAERMTCIDCRFDGPMNQLWLAGVFETPNMDLANCLGTDAGKDSHLLLWSHQYTVGLAVHEQAPDPSTGVGQWLANSATQVMSIDIVPQYQVRNLAFAQVVIPGGSTVLFTGYATGADGSQTYFEPPIIEPNVWALAGGPYVIRPGQTIQLDGITGAWPIDTPYSAGWDLNGDGSYDLSGDKPTVGYAYLVDDLHLSIGEHPITLRADCGWAEASDTTTLTIIGYGDIDLDGKVGYEDLGILAGNYGLTDKDWEDGDFNGDGCVDYQDLGILATWYGTDPACAQQVPAPPVLVLLAAGAVLVRTRRELTSPRAVSARPD